MFLSFKIAILYADWAKNREKQKKVTEILQNRDSLNVREEIARLDNGKA